MQVAIVNTYMCITQCGVKTVLVHCVYTAPSSPPRALTITMITSSSFHLSWTEPLATDQNGLIRQYLVNVTELNTGNVLSYTTTETEYTVGSLHPYYNYSCSVSAVTILPGPYSNSQTIQTEIDGKYVLVKYIHVSLSACYYCSAICFLV